MITLRKPRRPDPPGPRPRRAGRHPQQNARHGGGAALLAGLTLLAAAPGPLRAGEALPPTSALRTFSVPDGFALDVVVAEPDLGQPVYLTFDERGRLWVVQYLQFPWPEGMKVVGHDEYWRVKYDRFPPPAPPQHARGADKVTVFEDQDRDGYFETAHDFVSGLNIATSALPGRGGVWVLNPPYLLFYPDADRDDVPDGDPVVHLAGFGMEDLHAVANSLTWGPDGWLYGCQGSTCTASISRPGIDAPPVAFKGQCLWRYRPETREFELFAEGGYNNFGIAADRAFRLFTGTNGGKIGVHYVQGGYYQKTWGKHGPLTNPYAFGYFDAMPDHSSNAKLSQAMMWYEDGPFPEKYHGRLLVARILQQRIDRCELRPRGSTYEAFELDPVCASSEPFFRPVDLKDGPDGAVYIADWHEGNVTWNVTAEGEGVRRSTGRIYRLRHGARRSVPTFDYARIPTAALLDLLGHPLPWHRQIAQRILNDRRDATAAPRLETRLGADQGPAALETLWALHASGGSTPDSVVRGLEHPDPLVRLWTVRLLGDERRVTPTEAARLRALAASEPDPQVRSQLACTARRLPTSAALPLVRALAERSEDTADLHIPLLLWWAVEEKLREDRAGVLAWLEDPSLWAAPLFREAITARLGQRFTTERSRENLILCARLLAQAPDADAVLRLVNGMERGLAGDRVNDVPSELTRQLGQLWATSQPAAELLRFAVRLGLGEATTRALAAVADDRTPEAQRIELIRLLAERAEPRALDVLLTVVRHPSSPRVQAEALSGLQRFGEDRVARALLESAAQFDPGLRDRALTILASRPRWAALLLEAVDCGRLAARLVPPDVVVTLQSAGDGGASAIVLKHWGNVRRTPQELRTRAEAVSRLLAAGSGAAPAGRALFEQACSKCHVLFGEGRKVGPELTGIERSNRARLVEAIVDPGGSVMPEFTALQFSFTQEGGRDGDDEQAITGFVVEETANSVTLVDTAGNQITVPRSQIADRRVLTTSIMPEGLLDGFNEQQIRDLFAYLQATQRP